MIKTGIYAVDDICKRDSTFFRKDLKNVSIILYDKVIQEANADELAERILLLFADERGAYKRTYSKRFEDFDRTVLECLKNMFPKDEQLLLHDVGVSDGRTAVDFFELISIAFSNLQYTASDYNPSVYLLKKGRCTVTLSHTGKVLEILFPPFVFNTIKRDSYKHYPFNHLIRLFVQFLIASPLLKAYKLGKVQSRALNLFAPRVLKANNDNKNFCLEQHDLLQPFKEQVHVIRAMNVLNSSYFSDIEFARVLENLHSGLKDEGLLIAGSNQESGTVVHGGIYKKTMRGFQKIYQSGDGVAIDQQIIKFKNVV